MLLATPERELTADKVPYEVGRALFHSLARAQITGQTVGMLKLIFHRETRQILGVHCFGDNAAEILTGPDVDGALVGGGSLDPRGFAEIVLAAAS